MSALTKFVNIANTVRPPSLMVIFLLRRQQCQRQQYTPSMANVFIPFPSLQMFLWSSLLLVLKRVRELKLSNFDILLIENRKFANVSNTNGKWLLFILDLVWPRLFIFEMLTPWSSSARLPLILIDIKAKESIRHRKKHHKHNEKQDVVKI